MNCAVCSKSFPSYTSFLQHKEEHKTEPIKITSKKIETPISKLVNPNSDKFKRLYSNKLKDLKKTRRESERKIQSLNQQLNEFKTSFDDPNYNYFSESVINVNSISCFFKIKEFVDAGNLTSFLKSTKLITAFQNILQALIYGIIPISTPQRRKLTNADRNFIRKLDNASNSMLKQEIAKNSDSFINIVNTIAKSMKYLDAVHQN